AETAGQKDRRPSSGLSLIRPADPHHIADRFRRFRSWRLAQGRAPPVSMERQGGGRGGAHLCPHHQAKPGFRARLCKPCRHLQCFAFVRASELSRELLRKAFDLAPYFLKYQWCYIASTQAMIGDYEDGVMASRRGGNATLDTPGWRAVCLAQLGRLDEAKAAF